MLARMTGRTTRLAAAAGVLSFLLHPAVADDGAHGQAIETAQASIVPLQIRVDAGCVNGTAEFRIRNEGPTWPKSGHLEVYRTAGDLLVKTRSMRLAVGQTATFRVKGVGSIGTEVALRVRPTWTSRLFPNDYDARVQCAGEG